MERVKSVESHFNDTLFFHVNQVLDDEKPLSPAFSYEKLESYFKLFGEKRYVMDMVFYDPSQEATIKLQTECSSLAVRHPARVGAQQDTKKNILKTSTMAHLFEDVETKIIGNDDYFAEINWEIHKSFFKTAQFGLASLLGALGAGLVILSRSDFSQLKFKWQNWMLGVLGLVLIGVTAGWLYRFFHKK